MAKPMVANVQVHPGIFGLLVTELLFSFPKVGSGSKGVGWDALKLQERSYQHPHAEVQQERLRKMKKYVFSHSLTGVDRRKGLTQEEFVDVYDGKWPVIITDVVQRWKAYNWTRAFLQEHYGRAKVTARVTQGDTVFGIAGKLDRFLRTIPTATDHNWTYIEDELFFYSHPELMQDIEPISYLEEDFFQIFPEAVRPWSCMLLWGSAYSRSPLHIDPYNWTGTSAVLKGRKKWKLYPPGQDYYLHVLHDRRCGFPLECHKYNSGVDAFSQHLNSSTIEEADVIEFEQRAGELLVIPTGWFHQAYNTEETLAISGQVMNSQNYLAVLEEIIKAGNVARSNITPDFHTLNPSKQVEEIMSMLPDSVLDHGREVTKFNIQSRLKEEL